MEGRGRWRRKNLVLIELVQACVIRKNKDLTAGGGWRDLLFVCSHGVNLIFSYSKFNFHAAIGYCFGGACCMEMVRGGLAVSGVVSFHGVLNSRPIQQDLLGKDFDYTMISEGRNNPTPNVQVEIHNGALDPYVPLSEQDLFQGEMAASHTRFTFYNYGDTDHGLCNSLLPRFSTHAPSKPDSDSLSCRVCLVW